MIIRLIEGSSDPDHILHIVSEHFKVHGFAGIVYVRLSSGGANTSADGSAPDRLERAAQHIARAEFGSPDRAVNVALTNNSGGGRQRGEQAAGKPPANSDYLQSMHASGLADGIAFPAPGIGGRHAVIIARTSPGIDLAKVKMHRLHGIVRAAQTRISQIEMETANKADDQVDQQVDQEATQLPHRTTHLSPKERDVLQWISAGKSNKDIGTILGISANTVATHTKRIFAKLEVNDRVAAALVGVRLGYISLDVPGGDTPPAEDSDGNLLFVT